MGQKKINYSAKNFSDYRSELVLFIKQNYPEVYNDFNDASVGTMLIELLAAIGDNLSFQMDRVFQETLIDFAGQRESLYAIARTLGVKIPGNRPSITLADISFDLPVFGDSFDPAYAPIVKTGTSFGGGGLVFELNNDCDFNNPFSNSGIPNRSILPLRNQNGILTGYRVTKREIVKNGLTRTQTVFINQDNATPFYEVLLPDVDITEILGIVELEGFTSNTNNVNFNDINTAFFEVESLAEDKIFREFEGNSGLKMGKWVNVDRRFIKEFTNNGFCKITFGGGIKDYSSIGSFINNETFSRINTIANNLSLGEMVKPSTTLIIKYKVGGGPLTNIGINQISSVRTSIIESNGPDSNKNILVQQSIAVNNPIPAIGGAGLLTIEELRNLIRFNFASQHRCVTINDYYARIKLMDGRFGVPVNFSVYEEQNKIKIKLLNLNQDGSLNNSSNSILVENIAEYLANFKMINDLIEVSNGTVFNIGVNIYGVVNKSFDKVEVSSNIINAVIEFFKITRNGVGENLYISKLEKDILNIPGLTSLSKIEIISKVGGIYSLSIPPQETTANIINLGDDNILLNNTDGMFEIKKIKSDIVLYLKTA